MTPIVYLNGKLIDASEASVGVQNGGWLHGAGLFETMRAEHGRVFRLESHMARLVRSAAALLAEIPRDALPTEHDLTELLSRNGLKTARLRMTVSAGSMMEEPVRDSPPLTVCVSAAPLIAYPPAYYETGVTVVLCPFRLSPSDPVAGHKTTSYLPRLLALRHARRLRATETLWFTTDNQLAEGSISNVLIVSKGKVSTPPLDTPVLPGIARGLALDIARDCSWQVEERALTIDDLLDADEVMLTNAIFQVVPVTRVEKHDVVGGRVGPYAKQLLSEYRRRIQEECGAA